MSAVTLQALITARAKRREGATAGARNVVRDMENGYFVQVPTELGGYHHMVALGVEAGAGVLSEADARHIADNDPTTVAALEAVALAAEPYADCADYYDEAKCADCASAPLCAALATLRAALSPDPKEDGND